jgi:hypothetical protein
MQNTSRIRLIDGFLASVHIFSSAVDDVLAEQRREASATALTVSQPKRWDRIAHTESHSITDVVALLGVSSGASSEAVDHRGAVGDCQWETAAQGLRKTSVL